MYFLFEHVIVVSAITTTLYKDFSTFLDQDTGLVHYNNSLDHHLGRCVI